MYSIHRIQFKIERFLHYLDLNSKKNALLLLGLYNIFEFNNEVCSIQVLRYCQDKFGVKPHLKKFEYLIDRINQALDNPISITKKDDHYSLTRPKSLIKEIGNAIFKNFALYTKDKYELFDQLEEIELFLYEINMNTQKREAMLTSLITLTSEIDEVSFNEILSYSKQNFGITLGKDAFVKFIRELNEYLKSDISINRQGKDVYLSNIGTFRDKKREYELNIAKENVMKDLEKLDTNELISEINSTIRTNLKIVADSDRPKTEEEKIYENISSLLSENNLYSNSRAAMLSSLVIQLQTKSKVKFSHIRDLAWEKFNNKMSFNKFTNFIYLVNNLTDTDFVVSNKVFNAINILAFTMEMAKYDKTEIGLEDFVSHFLKSITDNSKTPEQALMDEELQTLIDKKLSRMETGRELFSKFLEKYRKSNYMHKAGDKLEIHLSDGTFFLDSQDEWLYILDFAIHDFYYKITNKMLMKYKLDDQSLLNISVNLLEMYKIFHGSKLNKVEKILLDEWIDRRLSIFEIVRVEHPLILVKDLLNEDIQEIIYDFHFSQTAIPGMILGMRLTKSGRLGSTSGISFIFNSKDKKRLLQEWDLYKKNHEKKKRINHLLFPFLFKSKKKFGINAISSLFIED